VPKRAYLTLRAEDVPALLRNVDAQWRNFFATALWTGLRKGELCGLVKTDVDLVNGTLLVARSYDRDTTKGGHTDTVPIADPLVPYLEDALRSSPSRWVFPAPDGSMRTESTDPQKILRIALARAGMVEGFNHAALQRRHAHAGAAHVRIPRRNAPTLCNLRHEALAPRAIPSPMRFHRHATATLLLRAGVDSHRVQRILRHTDVRTTLGIYGHLDVEDLREAVNAIAPAPSPAPTESRATEFPQRPSVPVASAEAVPFGAPVVQSQGSGVRESVTQSRNKT
jgi:integrase